MSRLLRQYVYIEVSCEHVGLSEDTLNELLDDAYARIEKAHQGLSGRHRKDPREDIEYEVYELTDNDNQTRLAFENVGVLPVAIYSEGEIPNEAIAEFRDAFVEQCKQAAAAHGLDADKVTFFNAYARRHVESVEQREVSF